MTHSRMTGPPKGLAGVAIRSPKQPAPARAANRNRRLRVEPLEARRLLDSTVVFSEVMYNPLGADETLEWLELHNQMAYDMDLSGWRLDGGIDFEFAAGTRIDAGGYLVVAADPGALAAAAGIDTPLGPFAGRLANGGEQIDLLNNNDRLMNRVDYRDSGRWPVAADGAGASLAMIDPDAATDESASWTHSAQIGGTPAAANFAHGQAGTVVTGETLLAADDPVGAAVPVDDSMALDWTGGAEPFDDSTWLAGNGPVGYDANPDFGPLLGADVAATMHGANASALVRSTFDVATPAAVSSLELQMRYDDGFVAYLNGQEVARRNAPDASASDLNVLAHYRLGEEDLGGSAGNVGDANTVDSVGTIDLARASSPLYSADTGAAGSALAVQFDGADDRYSVSTLPTTTNNNFGIEAWVKSNGSTDGNAVIAYNGNTGPGGWGLFRAGANYGVLYGGVALWGASPITTDWTHLAVARDAGVATFYVNGTAVATSDTTPNLPTLASGGGMMIGGNHTPGAPAEWFDGLIDEVRVFTFAQGEFDIDDTLVGGVIEPDGGLPHNAAATDERPTNESLTPEQIDLDAHLDKLVAGENTLAVHGLNLSADDTDFLIAPELIGTVSGSPETLLADDAPARTSIPTGADASLDWAQPGFDDSGPEWIAGSLGVGFDVDTGYDPLIGLDLEAAMRDQNAGAYVRAEFEVADPSTIDGLTLDVQSDDGLVAYLNGQEIARRNAPTAPTTLVHYRLGEDDPGAAAGAIGNSQTVDSTAWNALPRGGDPTYSADVGVAGSALSIDFDGAGDRFALAELPTVQTDNFAIEAWVQADTTAGNAVIAYNGSSSNGGWGLFRIGTNYMGLFGGVAFVGGAPVSLGAWTHLALVRDDGATTLYVNGVAAGTGGAPAPPVISANGGMMIGGNLADTEYFDGRIDEVRVLTFSPGQFTVNDLLLTSAVTPGRLLPAWDSPAVAPHSDDDALAGEAIDATHFASALTAGTNILAVHGLNAAADDDDFLVATQLTATRTQQLPHLTINEVAPAGDPQFFVEIANLGDAPVALDGYRLRTAGSIESTFALPSQTLAPGDRFAVSPPGLTPIDGDKLFLIDVAETFVLDGALVDDELRGRAADYGDDWLRPSTATPGAENQFLFHSDVVINEIMYHARPQLATDTTPYAENDEEWIELLNRGTQPVDLSGWSLDEAVRFDFPPATSLAAGELLVIAENPVALAAAYPSIRILGPYSGRLANGNEWIELDDAQGNPADRVHYFDDGRWPAAADGNGSSLELRDPRADNAAPEAWAASNEADRPDNLWQTYTYRGIAGNDAGPTQWNELHLGLLEAGEILLDDVHVIEDPDGAAAELMQNGDFEAADASWRLVGNHQHSSVIVDPDNAANQVLHLVATGATEYGFNHIESTFAGNVPLVNGRVYEISYRAKWLTGSTQLNSRLYFSQVAQTTILAEPSQKGTPGAVNSVWQANLGPTYDALRHAPLAPRSDEPVTVSVDATDADGIALLTLHYAVDGGAFSSVAMTETAAGHFEAAVPAQPNGAVVQFYVEGVDLLGGASAFPAAGADSRALYQVDDATPDSGALHDFRIIMTSADTDHMFQLTNIMSNDRLGATVVYNQQDVYYDIGVRPKGSRAGRPPTHGDAVGYNLRFDADNLFRGVHENVAIDRSGRTPTFGGQDEILAWHIIQNAGGMPGMYDDLIDLTAPRSEHDGSALLLMARYDGTFLDSQFADGGAGTVYEWDMLYSPTSTHDGTPEGIKLPLPDTFTMPDLQDLGDDKETYRWNFLAKNNRQRDDYDSVIAMAQAFSLTGAALDEATRAAIDVDQFLRVFGMYRLLGIDDTYTTNLNHNINFYARPEDGRMLAFPWDMDFLFSQINMSPTAALWNPRNINLNKLILLPHNLRVYYGHLHDMVQTTFNAEYMTPWLQHYSSLLPGQDMTGSAAYIGQRAAYVLGQMPATFDFAPTTASPLDVGLQSAATLAGRAWVNVRELRLAGSDEPLDVDWITDQQTAWADGWEVTIPVQFGTHPYTIEAYDFQGNLLDSVTFDVTSALSSRPVQDFLRVSEIMYHPANPTTAELAAGFNDDDDFEFIELVNTSDVQTLDLGGVAFTDGIDFTIDAGASLAPNERGLLVRNAAAFAVRYDTTGMNILGEYRDPIDDGNKLDNGGETLMLVDADAALVQQFTYNDSNSWPQAADGDGSSLEVVNVASDYDLPTTWYDSPQLGGSPGQVAAAAVLDRLVFYDNSAFDTIDDDAVAPDKQPLMPGQTATAANYTNFDRGINGLMIDLANPADNTLLDVGDFAFHVGNDNDPGSWPLAAQPLLTVRPGAGLGGADRVVITWPANAPTDTWLRVTSRADMPDTGLLLDDVFYFGNAVGETGNDPQNALVTAADLIAIRDNPRTAANRADITNPHDVDRNRLVDAVDQLMARNHSTGPFNALRLITPPAL